ncbi:MAG: DUF4168 domain-containing protein [Caulobacteraceae bacterium]|nr:DUF4168 domain-containing protein [Caulobacteraceae bacterium]
MRIAILAAVSTLALSAAPALAQDATTPAEPAGASATATAEITDAELTAYAAALAKVTPLAQALNGAAPSAEQQAEMAAAITGEGLTLERFNAISQAASSDAVVRARIALAQTPASATATSITDAEVEGFASAMSELLPIAQALNGAAPSPEQQAQMEAAITDAGLTRERFNEISQVVGTDAHLRARLVVADARAGR